jgi:branched-chain amino acid transport system ATP-binding protein
MPLLEIENLVVQYGAIRALKGISLYVEKGSLVTLIGANGAGKSTLLNTITGLVKAVDGTIRFSGEEITNLDAHEIVHCGICQVPEGRKIFAELTVEENLYAGAYILSDKKEVKNNLEKVYELFPRLAERRKQEGGTLSGGEQQMLAIARGIMSNPQLLLLDEPSLGLAPLIVDKIFEFILQINQQGTTILLVEQNANVALQVSTYGYVLETGTIRFHDTSENLRNNDVVRHAYLGIVS